MATILVVADNSSSRTLIDTLQFEHHCIEADQCVDSALRELRRRRYDLVIVKKESWALPIQALCSDFRSACPSTAILMVTERHDMDDLEKALVSGADDYLDFAVDPREVKARVRALARRYVRTYV